mmetsp:Transcript_11637/g.17202  ORF Transcript_11637/g.17202 Transcript_11637/m.17202 type:complete len:325 (-) Transcript_11637:44-1018(-)
MLAVFSAHPVFPLEQAFDGHTEAVGNLVRVGLQLLQGEVVDEPHHRGHRHAHNALHFPPVAPQHAQNLDSGIWYAYLLADLSQTGFHHIVILLIHVPSRKTHLVFVGGDLVAPLAEEDAGHPVHVAQGQQHGRPAGRTAADLSGHAVQILADHVQMLGLEALRQVHVSLLGPVTLQVAVVKRSQQLPQLVQLLGFQQLGRHMQHFLPVSQGRGEGWGSVVLHQQVQVLGLVRADDPQARALPPTGVLGGEVSRDPSTLLLHLRCGSRRVRVRVCLQELGGGAQVGVGHTLLLGVAGPPLLYNLPFPSICGTSPNLLRCALFWHF